MREKMRMRKKTKTMKMMKVTTSMVMMMNSKKAISLKGKMQMLRHLNLERIS